MARETVTIPAGSLSFILNGTNLDDFIEGDYVTITLLNNLTDRTNGAKDSVTITERVDGNAGEIVFRMRRYSDADIFLSAAWNKRPIEIFNGSLKEDFFSGQNNALENWTVENGTFTAPPVHVKNNQTQLYSVEYTIEFRNLRRTI